METVVGIEALKDKWRYAKLKGGDLRGLKNRFELSDRLNVNALETYYNATATKEGKVEIEAQLWEEGTSIGSEYNMKDLIDRLKNKTKPIEIQLVIVKWNKYGNDAKRSNFDFPFIYTKK